MSMVPPDNWTAGPPKQGDIGTHPVTNNDPLSDFISNPFGGITNAINNNPLSILFNPEVQRQYFEFAKERVLPMLAGVGIIIIGIAFVLSGTKAARVAGGVVELVATKGAGKIAGAASTATKAVS